MLLVGSFILWILPVTTAVYDYRTDLRTDSFPTVDTGAIATTASVTLFTTIYDADTDTLTIISDLSTDAPVYASYNATNRALGLSGLTANTTRAITASYDITALSGADALDTFMDWFPYIWLVLIVAFPIAGLAAIWTGRA